MLTSQIKKRVWRLAAATIEDLAIEVYSWRKPDKIGHEDCANSILAWKREASAERYKMYEKDKLRVPQGREE